MAFRTQALALAGLTLALGAAQAELRFRVRHDHLWKSGIGSLDITADGVSYQETDNQKHRWRWTWQDIQQLRIAPRTLRVLTYEDSPWKLGRDREHRFDLIGPGTFDQAWRLLAGRLDQRLVAALADPGMEPLWETPAKHLRRFGGSHGRLIATEKGLLFQTLSPAASRTWRWQDIENLSSTGPFQLTITTYERALLHYGNLKSFTFQLKQPLKESRYRDLWMRINQNHGLKLLTTYIEGERNNR